MAKIEFKTLLLQLIYSLTFADNISDVAGDVNETLKRAGFSSQWTGENEGSTIRQELSDIGIVSLWHNESTTRK